MYLLLSRGPRGGDKINQTFIIYEYDTPKLSNEISSDWLADDSNVLSSDSSYKSQAIWKYQ